MSKDKKIKVEEKTKSNSKIVTKKDLVKAGLVKPKTQAVVDVTREEQLIKMRDQSGEGDSKPFPFIPIIEVDNHKEQEMVKGRKVEVLCEPNFVITVKDENNEFIKTVLGVEMRGIIVLVRYMVEKRWDETDTTPYFRSFEFDPAAFQNVDIPITIKQAGEEIFKGSYAEFKQDYVDRYILSAILYTIDESTKQLTRFKLKGVSRSAYWDYAKLFKRPDTISAHITKFSIGTVSEGGKNYNHIVFDNECDVTELDEIMVIQTELHDFFDKFLEKEENIKIKGEIIPQQDPNVSFD